jgi:cytochrome c556
MNRIIRALGALTLAALPLISTVAWADDEDTIAYRKHIMRTLDEQTAALGMILSGAIPEDNLVLHMDAIATTAGMALSSFEPNVPGGDAKPEVWSNWEDFAKRMNDFAAKTANMAKVAHDEDPQTAVELAIEALDCKGCHKVYNSKRTDDE